MSDCHRVHFILTSVQQAGTQFGSTSAQVARVDIPKKDDCASLVQMEQSRQLHKWHDLTFLRIIDCA